MDILDLMALNGQLPAQQQQDESPITGMMYPPTENPFTPMGLVGVTRTLKKGSGGAQALSEADYLQKQLQALQVKGLAQQQTGVESYEKQLQDLTKAQAVNPWQAVAAGLSDFFSEGKTNKLGDIQRQKLTNQQLALAGVEKVQKAKDDIAENQRNLIKDQLDYQKALAKNEADEEKWKALLGVQKQKLEKTSMLPGQEQADKDFGKEYADWNQKGGRAGYLKSKQSLETAIEELRAKPTLTGTVAKKMTPASMISKIDEDSARVEQQVKSTVIQMVKQLGANPTDTDLKEIQKTVWDKDLPVEMNIEKIQSFLQEQERKAAAKDEASRYFEKTGGTLQGQNMATNRPSGGLTPEQEKRRQELLKKAGGK